MYLFLQPRQNPLPNVQKTLNVLSHYHSQDNHHKRIYCKHFRYRHAYYSNNFPKCQYILLCCFGGNPQQGETVLHIAPFDTTVLSCIYCSRNHSSPDKMSNCQALSINQAKSPDQTCHLPLHYHILRMHLSDCKKDMSTRRL